MLLRLMKLVMCRRPEASRRERTEHAEAAENDR
jgi:hypothetical protein